MTVPPPVPPPGRLYLYDQAVPPLSDGQYTVTVHTELDGTAPMDAALADTSAVIEVAGARLALAPGDVLTCDPAPNSTGVDADTLPHVVLSRHSLPWERSASTSARLPWLALLVLDGDIGTVTRNTTAPAGGGPCDTLSLPAPVAAAVLPAAADLPLLCHVRQVNVTDRDASAPPDGLVALVVANRLASRVAGTRTRACLVSLEAQDALLAQAGTARRLSEGAVTVVLLHDWSFTTGPDINFGTAISHVAGHAASLASGRSSPSVLPYTTREGGQGTAGYAGPLSGLPPVPSATRTDAGPAAAVQLGRLLAAADRAQVRAISDWQRADLLAPPPGTSGGTPAGTAHPADPADRADSADEADEAVRALHPMQLRVAAAAGTVAAALARAARPVPDRWSTTPTPPAGTAGPPSQPSLAARQRQPGWLGKP